MKKNILLIVIILAIVLLVMFGPRLLSELLWHRSLDASMFELQLRFAGRDAMNGDEAAWYAEKAEKNAGELEFPEDMQYPVSAKSYGEMDYYILNAQEHSPCLIVYFPGGTYIDRPQTEHWLFADALAAETGAEVWVPDYPKLPDYTAETAYPILRDFCRQALGAESYDKLIFMGDSAGGGMALSLANQLTVSLLETPEMPQPDELILLSPWLDVSMHNELLPIYQKKDPKLDQETLRAAGEAWAGSWYATEQTVSPLYAYQDWLRADPEHQLTLFAGTRELLYPDIIRFSDLLKEKGLGHQLVIGEGMNHIWPLYRAYGVPEAEDAFQTILQEIQN